MMSHFHTGTILALALQEVRGLSVKKHEKKLQVMCTKLRPIFKQH